ncbi:MAG TPA: PSD1 and planctomycete cytochrome C domain-containing protein [Tepidisphaeraceae bacterium]|nr:PSD1 and planctomycete cytochrome C domain-containing protein [Tepidisphaeraceae bacterium]
MHRYAWIAGSVTCLALASALLPGGWARGEDAPLSGRIDLPPAVARKIDFAHDVMPILKESCVQCHANGKSKGGLKIDTREALLAGGESGPSIIEGNSAKSLAIQLVAGMDEDRIMPAKGKRLTPEQIGILRAWIDQGAAWPKELSLGSQWRQAPLEPRRPEIPEAAPGSGLTNPIDLVLQPYFAQHQITPGRVVDDRVYARRVYLDIVGLVPPPADLEAFVADQSSDKRAALVRKLLADRTNYAAHWMTFWNDALRNDYKGTGYIDGGRKHITQWLYDSLTSNKPYNQFVRDLVTGENGAAGFTGGIIWRGVVNASQTREMQAAQNLSQVFMGVNMKCASCHDSFISDWKLEDAYGLAGIYADTPPEMAQCDKPLGKVAKLKFIYPQLGDIDADKPKPERLEQLAGIMTSERNGRLTRTMVNRIWQRMLGRGLVEPADEMDNEPWNADLLDALAVKFADDGYNVQKLIELIATSRAYQLPAVVATEENAEEYVFAGPSIKRMSAEQFVDAVVTLTGAKLNTKPSKLENAPMRAVMTLADPLTVALGRPNREQVVTHRPSAATTLEALELTNGPTLTKMLQQGAKRLAKEKTDGKALIEALYAHAVGRGPSEQELALAQGVIGEQSNPQGVEDFLWVMVMLPEFQLIR